jgi:hypothetical protein
VTIIRDPLARYLSHELHWLEFKHPDIYKEAMVVRGSSATANAYAFNAKGYKPLLVSACECPAALCQDYLVANTVQTQL